MPKPSHGRQRAKHENLINFAKKRESYIMEYDKNNVSPENIIRKQSVNSLSFIEIFSEQLHNMLSVLCSSWNNHKCEIPKDIQERKYNNNCFHLIYSPTISGSHFILFLASYCKFTGKSVRRSI